MEVLYCIPTVCSFGIVVAIPTQARLDILRIHSRKMNLTRGINLRKIAEAMPGKGDVFDGTVGLL